MTSADRTRVLDWLSSQVNGEPTGLTEQQFYVIRHAANRAEFAWSEHGCGNTYAIMAIAHYRNKLKPGSLEWRPGIILKAIARTLNTEQP